MWVQNYIYITKNKENRGMKIGNNNDFYTFFSRKSRKYKLFSSFCKKSIKKV